MPGKPKSDNETGGDRKPTTVKIDPQIHYRAKQVAQERGIELSKYLSDLLRGPVDRDYETHLEAKAKEAAEFKESRKKKS